jgi:hypothetical protein
MRQASGARPPADQVGCSSEQYTSWMNAAMGILQQTEESPFGPAHLTLVGGGGCARFLLVEGSNPTLQQPIICLRCHPRCRPYRAEELDGLEEDFKAGQFKQLFETRKPRDRRNG